MRFLAFFALLAASATAGGSEADFRARAALALALALEQPPAPPAPTYGELRGRAVREGLPLLVWLGTPPCMTDVGTLHWETPDADWGGFRGPGVVVSLPDGGELYVAGFFAAGDADGPSLRGLIARTRAAWGRARAGMGSRAAPAGMGMSYSAPMAPMMRAAPARMMPMRMGRGGGGC